MISKDSVRWFYDVTNGVVFGPPRSKLFPAELLSSMDACNAAVGRFEKNPSPENHRDFWRLSTQLAEKILTGVKVDRPGYNTELLRSASTASEILRLGCRDIYSDNSFGCTVARVYFTFHMAAILTPRELEFDSSRPESLRKYPELQR